MGQHPLRLCGFHQRGLADIMLIPVRSRECTCYRATGDVVNRTKGQALFPAVVQRRVLLQTRTGLEHICTGFTRSTTLNNQSLVSHSSLLGSGGHTTMNILDGPGHNSTRHPHP
jgi:hypothetical protein